MYLLSPMSIIIFKIVACLYVACLYYILLQYTDTRIDRVANHLWKMERNDRIGPIFYSMLRYVMYQFMHEEVRHLIVNFKIIHDDIYTIESYL